MQTEDPSVVLPDAVKKQMAKDEAAMEAEIAKRKKKPTAEAPPEPQTPEPEQVEPVEPDTSLVEADAAPVEPEPQAEPEPENLSAEIARLRDSLRIEKHRNDSLEGRVETQLRPLAEQVRALRAELEKAKRQTPVAPSEPETPPYLKHLKGEERQAWADEPEVNLPMEVRMAKGYAETAQAAVERELADVKAQMADIRSSSEQAQRQSRVSALWQKVESRSPGAIEINTRDTGWVSFLNQLDPDTEGATYGDRGDLLVSIGDAKGIAALIEQYRKTLPSEKVRAQVKIGRAHV